MTKLILETEKELSYEKIDDQKKKKRSQPWNIQDYIDYTHREDPHTISKIELFLPN